MVLIEARKQKDKVELLSGKVRCYYSKGDSVISNLNLLPGDKIVFESSLDEIQPAKNSWDFDYKSFALGKGISHQAFIKGTSTKELTSDRFIGFKNYALRIRISLKEILSEYLENPLHRSLLESLILGDKSNLDKDLKSSFSKLGVIHVLAVSGLHVGLIYQMIIGILVLVKKWKYRGLLEFLSVFGGLIIFAFISGLSPSVCRAVIMFIIMAFAKLIRRESNIYNTLALTAFLILIFSPNMLFDLGFQLSFLAVIGIVFLFPKLESFMPFQNPVLRKVSELSLISISATFGTLAVTLYYFKQFPSFFIISNLIIVPMAIVILKLGIALLIFHKIGFLAKLISELISVLTNVMFKISEYLSELPFALIENIPFDQNQFVFLIVLSMALIILINTRNKKSIVLFILIMFSFSTYNYFFKFRNSDPATLLVFSSDAYAIIDNHSMMLCQIQNDSLSQGALKNIQKHFAVNHLEINQISAIPDDETWLTIIKDVGFLRPVQSLKDGVSGDWVICDNTNFRHILNSSYNPSKGFILDDNISFFKRRKLIEQLTKKGHYVHDLSESGALELILENGN